MNINSTLLKTILGLLACSFIQGCNSNSQSSNADAVTQLPAFEDAYADPQYDIGGDLLQIDKLLKEFKLSTGQYGQLVNQVDGQVKKAPIAKIDYLSPEQWSVIFPLMVGPKRDADVMFWRGVTIHDVLLELKDCHEHISDTDVEAIIPQVEQFKVYAAKYEHEQTHPVHSKIIDLFKKFAFYQTIKLDDFRLQSLPWVRLRIDEADIAVKQRIQEEADNKMVCKKDEGNAPTWEIYTMSKAEKITFRRLYKTRADLYKDSVEHRTSVRSEVKTLFAVVVLVGQAVGYYFVRSSNEMMITVGKFTADGEEYGPREQSFEEINRKNIGNGYKTLASVCFWIGVVAFIQFVDIPAKIVMLMESAFEFEDGKQSPIQSVLKPFWTFGIKPLFNALTLGTSNKPALWSNKDTCQKQAPWYFINSTVKEFAFTGRDSFLQYSSMFFLAILLLSPLIASMWEVPVEILPRLDIFWFLCHTFIALHPHVFFGLAAAWAIFSTSGTNTISSMLFGFNEPKNKHNDPNLDHLYTFFTGQGNRLVGISLFSMTVAAAYYLCNQSVGEIIQNPGGGLFNRDVVYAAMFWLPLVYATGSDVDALLLLPIYFGIAFAIVMAIQYNVANEQQFDPNNIENVDIENVGAALKTWFSTVMPVAAAGVGIYGAIGYVVSKTEEAGRQDVYTLCYGGVLTFLFFVLSSHRGGFENSTLKLLIATMVFAIMAEKKTEVFVAGGSVFVAAFAFFQLVSAERVKTLIQPMKWFLFFQLVWSFAHNGSFGSLVALVLWMFSGSETFSWQTVGICHALQKALSMAFSTEVLTDKFYSLGEVNLEHINWNKWDHEENTQHVWDWRDNYLDRCSRIDKRLWSSKGHYTTSPKEEAEADRCKLWRYTHWLHMYYGPICAAVSIVPLYWATALFPYGPLQDPINKFSDWLNTEKEKNGAEGILDIAQRKIGDYWRTNNVEKYLRIAAAVCGVAGVVLSFLYADFFADNGSISDVLGHANIGSFFLGGYLLLVGLVLRELWRELFSEDADSLFPPAEEAVLGPANLPSYPVHFVISGLLFSVGWMFRPWCGIGVGLIFFALGLFLKFSGKLEYWMVFSTATSILVGAAAFSWNGGINLLGSLAAVPAIVLPMLTRKGARVFAWDGWILVQAVVVIPAILYSMKSGFERWWLFGGVAFLQLAINFYWTKSSGLNLFDNIQTDQTMLVGKAMIWLMSLYFAMGGGYLGYWSLVEIPDRNAQETSSLSTGYLFVGSGLAFMTIAATIISYMKNAAEAVSLILPLLGVLGVASFAIITFNKAGLGKAALIGVMWWLWKEDRLAWRPEGGCGPPKLTDSGAMALLVILGVALFYYFGLTTDFTNPHGALMKNAGIIVQPISTFVVGLGDSVGGPLMCLFVFLFAWSIRFTKNQQWMFAVDFVDIEFRALQNTPKEFKIVTTGMWKKAISSVVLVVLAHCFSQTNIEIALLAFLGGLLLVAAAVFVSYIPKMSEHIAAK